MLELQIEFEKTSSTNLFGVTITFLDSGEEIGGTFSTAPPSDEFQPSWYSSDEAEDLYDEFWEVIECAVISTFYE